MSRRYVSWSCVAAAALLSIAPSGAHAQEAISSTAEPSVLSDDELEYEMLRLRQQGGPVLWPAGLTLGLGLGLGALGGLLAGAGALSEHDHPSFGTDYGYGFFSGYSSGSGSGGGGDGSDRLITAGAVLAGLGGALLIIGIVWLIERAGPYRADAPRRNHIGELQRERRQRARRALTSFVPGLSPVEGGAVVSGVFVL